MTRQPVAVQRVIARVLVLFAVDIAELIEIYVSLAALHRDVTRCARDAVWALLISDTPLTRLSRRS